MQRFVRGLKAPRPLILPACMLSIISGAIRLKLKPLIYTGSFSVPHLTASNLDTALEPQHVQTVHQHLLDKGMLKITLGFRDDESRYLQNLILSLSRRHGHGLPIDHSASRGWFWDVRPSTTTFQSNGHRARSETMRDFPWHTDCSYEDRPPRYFALHVLRPDMRGGGTFSALSVQRVVDRLSGAARAALGRPEYRIEVPPEFVRSSSRDHGVGSLLSVDAASGSVTMRYREDIMAPMGPVAASAMDELRGLLRSPEVERETLRLRSESMPRGSLLLLDNRRWLHARNEVKDPERHLRRVRWDAIPFNATSG